MTRPSRPLVGLNTSGVRARDTAGGRLLGLGGPVVFIRRSRELAGGRADTIGRGLFFLRGACTMGLGPDWDR